MTKKTVDTPLCACGAPCYRRPNGRPFARCLACIKIKAATSGDEKRKARLEAVLARHRGDGRRGNQ